jgi:hypothetical protein
VFKVIIKPSAYQELTEALKWYDFKKDIKILESYLQKDFNSVFITQLKIKLSLFMQFFIKVKI